MCQDTYKDSYKATLPTTDELGGDPLDISPTLADVEFAKVTTSAGNEKSLMMDFYLPEDTEEATPVVLYIYGGAWMMGDHTLNEWKNGTYANDQVRTLLNLPKSGITVVTVGYRLAYEDIFPAQIYDVKGAIRYLKANAAEYGIDPDRIAVMGESAGAQIALLTAVSNDEEELEGTVGGNLDYDSDVCGCVDCFGMTDFTTLAADLYSRDDLITDEKVAELVDVSSSTRSMLFGLNKDGLGLGEVVAHPDQYPEEYALVKQGSALFLNELFGMDNA